MYLGDEVTLHTPHKYREEGVFPQDTCGLSPAAHAVLCSPVCPGDPPEQQHGDMKPYLSHQPSTQPWCLPGAPDPGGHLQVQNGGGVTQEGLRTFYILVKPFLEKTYRVREVRKPPQLLPWGSSAMEMQEAAVACRRGDPSLPG